MQTLIDRFLDDRALRSDAPTTIRLYKRLLQQWLRWHSDRGYPPDIGDVSFAHISDFFADLPQQKTRYGRPFSANSIRGIYRVLRSYWIWLYSVDAISADQRRIFDRGRIAIPREPSEPRPALNRDELNQLIETCDQTETGLRDRAIMLLLWQSGARCSELAQLSDDCVDLEKRKGLIKGKGGRWDFIFWARATQIALGDYLRVRSAERGALFRGCSSRNKGGPVTDNLIRLMIKRRAAAAGIDLPENAPVHGFRHGSAREMRRRGATREEVRDLMRHQSLETTRRYLGIDDEPRRNLHTRLWGE
jgi:site-specific recombinase XerD